MKKIRQGWTPEKMTCRKLDSRPVGKVTATVPCRATPAPIKQTDLSLVRGVIWYNSPLHKRLA
ncbi:hypothetical protein PISMIDRAFT_681283 [Pisolithus microcarpus 441]|uniref:Uncharacterized protein n=1 Tax=Pisolithus microcarpus 441 TaxID=765257 RepID=A0A0C9Y9K3_9AGAM|nr:hypothetical protein PISMIDRAFT_681283 [Pisolithus microcarpus 441]